MLTYVVNAYPARRQAVEALLAADGLRPRWWRGIDGEKWGLASKNAELGTHAIGCALSHYTLWQHLYETGCGESLVMEDDVVLCEGFLREFDAQYPAPDVGFAYVGYLPRPGQPIPFGTFCYLIRRHAIPFLLKACDKCETAIDCQLIEVLPSIRYAVFAPSLAVDTSYMRGAFPNASHS